MSDVDWYVLSNLMVGTSYNVLTYQLTGGADTVMILYDQNGTILKNNDDKDRCYA